MSQADPAPALPLRERLHALYPGASGRTLKQWLTLGRVRVNGAVVGRGDVLVEARARVDLGRPAPPCPAPLRLVHEDAHLVVIDKPAGLLAIATETERSRTAYRLLQDWMHVRGEGRIFVVHRLDRETSGLLVFARAPAVKQGLQAQFRRRSAERVYVARVEGVVREDAGELTSRIVEDRSLRVRSVGGASRAGGGGSRRAGASRGKEAITRYRVLRRVRGATVLQLTLITGRRGQIRAQLAERGHPIVGDRGFGSARDPFGRVCLHATRLGLTYPAGRRMVFESPVPPDFLRP